jgi:hypothetical protein
MACPKLACWKLTLKDQVGSCGEDVWHERFEVPSSHVVIVTIQIVQTLCSQGSIDVVNCKGNE